MQFLATEPKLLLTSMGIDVVELDALLVARCQPSMSVADLEALRNRIPEIRARRPAGLSCLFVVPANALNLMDERRRCACVELATELEPLLRARAYVVPSTASADARVAVSTIDMLAGSRVPTEVFHDLASALGWLALTDVSLRGADLLFTRALLASQL